MQCSEGSWAWPLFGALFPLEGLQFRPQHAAMSKRFAGLTGAKHRPKKSTCSAWWRTAQAALGNFDQFRPSTLPNSSRKALAMGGVEDSDHCVVKWQRQEKWTEWNTLLD